MNLFFHVSDGTIRRMLLATLVSFVLFQWGCGSKSFRFFVAFDEAPGLKIGNEVRYLGLKVGKVEKISIQQSEGTTKPQVLVTVAILDRGLKLRRDDHFKIGTLGFLGEDCLNITPGASTSALIPEGETVHGEGYFIDLEKAPIFLKALLLASRLNSLPEDKREDLLKAFERLIDQAGGHDSGPSKPRDSKNPE
jgi:ABC-type transporter Mla subunit MlaD